MSTSSNDLQLPGTLADWVPIPIPFWGLGFRVWGLGLRVEGSPFKALGVQLLILGFTMYPITSQAAKPLNP